MGNYSPQKVSPYSNSGVAAAACLEKKKNQPSKVVTKGVQGFRFSYASCWLCELLCQVHVATGKISTCCLRKHNPVLLARTFHTY